MKHFLFYSCLRSKTYEMISVWCNIMKTGSRIEVVIKDLLQEIFTDLNVTQQYLAPKVSMSNNLFAIESIEYRNE